VILLGSSKSGGFARPSRARVKTCYAAVNYVGRNIMMNMRRL